MRPLRLASVALVLTLGCGDSTVGHPAADAAPVIDATPPGPDAFSSGCVPQSGTNVALQLFVGGLTAPVLLTAPPSDTRQFVVEQTGTIRVIQDGALVATPFLDVSSLLLYGGEQGLLGLAFHPDYATNGRFFIYYTATNPGGGDPYLDIVAEYHVSQTDPNVADPAGSVILSISDYASNHNGGMIAFGPDGDLYIGTGDGGGGGDPNSNGQSKAVLLAKMLRIDVDGAAPYTIPADNPFVADGAALHEIYHYGLRNPWRWSFDRVTGDQWIGDVGQDSWEEVDHVVAGQKGLDFGWSQKEGLVCYTANPGCDLNGYTDPIAVYPNPPGGDANARAVSGGFVYRGACYPDLVGRYFFGDYVTTEISSIDTTQTPLPAAVAVPYTGSITGLSGWGEDAYGELYVMSHITGEVFRLTAGP